MRTTTVYNTTKYFCCQQDLNNQVQTEIVANAFDVYSIGCLLYYLLTKEFLKQPLKRVGVQTNQLKQRFGESITDLLCGMLCKDQMSRYVVDDIL